MTKVGEYSFFLSASQNSINMIHQTSQKREVSFDEPYTTSYIHARVNKDDEVELWWIDKTYGALKQHMVGETDNGQNIRLIESYPDPYSGVSSTTLYPVLSTGG